MNNKNYFTWFISDGWKKYALLFILALVLNISFFSNFKSLIEESDSVIALILMTLILASSTVAIIYHSIDYYRNTKKVKK